MSISGLFELDDPGDSSGDATPVGRLSFELLLPQRGQGIELGSTVVFTRLPLGSNPPAIFQFVQRRIERAVADAQHIAGNLFQTLADGPSIQRLQGQYFENQHVQSPLDEVRRLAHEVSSRLPS